MYKGVDIRPYASKFQDVFVVVLNDARLFGRHVADFLWPIAHFKDFIIKSRLVTSRSKKDSMGKPKVFVPAEEEEVFYGELLGYSWSFFRQAIFRPPQLSRWPHNVEADGLRGSMQGGGQPARQRAQANGWDPESSVLPLRIRARLRSSLRPARGLS